MLTRRQAQLLTYLQSYSAGSDISPSFVEMQGHLGLASKAGVHRLLVGLEERGYIRRIPNRSRAIEVLKTFDDGGGMGSKAEVQAANENVLVSVPVVGKIAAGTPIAAIQANTGWVSASHGMLGTGEHFALEVAGDSMIDAGIFDGDTVLLRRQDTALDGDVVVALIDSEVATLKRFRRRGRYVHLEAANPAYVDVTLEADRVLVQGRLVGLLRSF